MNGVKIICGCCIEQLRLLPEESVQCCVTSPPYWGLRDYGVAGQIGLERTPEEYVARMVEVFREVRRVLREDGTCWVNLGDSYASGGRGGGMAGERGEKQRINGGALLGPKRAPEGLKDKDLVGIPWRVAFALQAPVETHLIADRADCAWMAAMIDGEGCITIPECRSGHDSGSSFPPIIQIRMCDTQCLEKCIQLTGKGGNLNKQLPPSYAEANQRACYQWRINGPTVASVLADVYQFLLIKRKQACVAWTLQKIRDSYETKRGVPIPDVARGKQQECRRLIGRLNRREAVDLPTWIEEPKFIVQPGWYLRQDVIWSKPNPMPESVTDRCTKAHEYIFMLTKAPHYFYDAEAIKEPVNGGAHARKANVANSRMVTERAAVIEMVGSRNKRDVWPIVSAPYSEAHFATFPPDLIKPCILAGTSARGCCPKCGAPWERIMQDGEPLDEWKRACGADSAGEYHGQNTKDYQRHKAQPASTVKERILRGMVEKKTIGWQPTCECNPTRTDGTERPNFEDLTIPCTVLDPFGGSGTTGMVAMELGRKAVLIEINPEYVKLADQRCNTTPGLALA